MLDKKEVEAKTERMLDIRNAIVNAIPDESDAHELCVSGLSIFLQAALHMADGDVNKVQQLVSHVMELAQELNNDAEGELWSKDPNKGTVH